jgi:uncharacterized protein
MVVRRLKDRLRSKFNVTVAETDHQEVWQRAEISVAIVGSDEPYVLKALQLALEEAERSAPECIVQGNIEIV